MNNPLVHVQRFLPKTFRGRCSTPKLIRTACPRTPKRDTLGQYEPPTETTSLKSRHKVRQVRRLRCLEQLYGKYHFDQCSPQLFPPGPEYDSLILLWAAICRAQGYGNSWSRWILQFESIPAIPIDLPPFHLLYDARQLTQFDADAFCQYEAKLRQLSRKHEMALDTKFKSGSHLYKQIKGHENKILPGFPTKTTAQATLCRATKGPMQILIHQPVSFRLFAAARFGDALVRIIDQQDNHLTCAYLDGRAPAQGDLTQEIYVTDVHEMAPPFRDYWQQFWNRDSDEEEHTDQPWQEVIDTLRNRIPPTACLTVTWEDPNIIAQTIARLKPL